MSAFWIGFTQTLRTLTNVFWMPLLAWLNLSAAINTDSRIAAVNAIAALGCALFFTAEVRRGDYDADADSLRAIFVRAA